MTLAIHEALNSEFVSEMVSRGYNPVYSKRQKLHGFFRERGKQIDVYIVQWDRYSNAMFAVSFDTVSVADMSAPYDPKKDFPNRICCYDLNRKPRHSLLSTPWSRWFYAPLVLQIIAPAWSARRVVAKLRRLAGEVDEFLINGVRGEHISNHANCSPRVYPRNS